VIVRLILNVSVITAYLGLIKNRGPFEQEDDQSHPLLTTKKSGQRLLQPERHSTTPPGHQRPSRASTTIDLSLRDSKKREEELDKS
jgi:hypothetical protein